jgi:hypothetical protein
MKTRTYFAFRIDVWDDASDSIVADLVGVDDFEVAEATYRAAGNLLRVTDYDGKVIGTTRLNAGDHVAGIARQARA